MIQKDGKSSLNARRRRYIAVILGLLFGIIVFYFTSKWVNSLIVLFAFPIVGEFLSYSKKKLAESAKISHIELVFPDFLQLMASNLRAGMTIDRALLASARKEFAPLDAEILNVGKDLVTGKDISVALQALSVRLNSEKIKKTIYLLNTGIISGGNLAILLEETAVNMRERLFVEKRAASNVLMYVIFIFFAVAIGAPTLFGLSSVLVEVLTKILGTIPSTETQAANLPFTLTKISVPIAFIRYYSVVFLITMCILGSFVLGLVSKGDEKDGLKYMLPITILSVAIYFIIRITISSQFSALFG